MAVLNVLPILLFLYFTREPVAAVLNQNLSVSVVQWLSSYSLGLFLGAVLFLAVYNFLPKIANAMRTRHATEVKKQTRAALIKYGAGHKTILCALMIRGTYAWWVWR